MNNNFKKTTSISAKWKYLTIANDGKFINTETGEEVPVADLIEQAMGNTPFDLSVSTKTEEDV